MLQFDPVICRLSCLRFARTSGTKPTEVTPRSKRCELSLREAEVPSLRTLMTSPKASLKVRAQSETLLKDALL
jgi:hypothetical protein